MTNPPDQGGLRVLVVDDSPDIRWLIEVLIDQHGHGWQVIGSAKNGEQAVDQARAAQPDVVLLDVSMPGMDGIEALPLVHEAAPQAVVVMLTGFADPAIRASATAAGARSYLEKENLTRTLVPRLEAIMARHGDDVDAGGQPEPPVPPPPGVHHSG